jgi:hypothetical protein
VPYPAAEAPPNAPAMQPGQGRTATTTTPSTVRAATGGPPADTPTWRGTRRARFPRYAPGSDRALSTDKSSITAGLRAVTKRELVTLRNRRPVAAARCRHAGIPDSTWRYVAIRILASIGRRRRHDAPIRGHLCAEQRRGGSNSGWPAGHRGTRSRATRPIASGTHENTWTCRLICPSGCEKSAGRRSMIPLWVFFAALWASFAAGPERIAKRRRPSS